LVEKTKDLTKKIAEAKAGANDKVKTVIGSVSQSSGDNNGSKESSPSGIGRLAAPANRIKTLVKTLVAKPKGQLQPEGAVMQQFNSQFEHFMDDAPACDICGSITVRNGTCYKCFNCGNSMGCS
jgi:hypothetical protein